MAITEQKCRNKTKKINSVEIIFVSSMKIAAVMVENMQKVHGQ